MRQEFYRPDAPESPPAHYTSGQVQSVEVTLTQEAKKQAAKKANRIGRMFMVLAIISLPITHSLSVFFTLVVVMVAVNFVAWRYFLKIEREGAAGLALHAPSLDEE